MVKEWRKKKDQGGAYQEKDQQTFFVNYIDEKNIALKSEEWKKTKPKTSLARNREVIILH
jgi:hypothetical protein